MIKEVLISLMCMFLLNIHDIDYDYEAISMWPHVIMDEFSYCASLCCISLGVQMLYMFIGYIVEVDLYDWIYIYTGTNDILELT